ncbi:hypothetical protein NA57DRAFT_73019 [Rhizodiscina lignyota]|uniref:DNA-binding protein REB1 n=1 Tax=Rhizodiscina lignyota TaxID=1504668 RepID=A0A9P4II84_9PEZI|nr:hypothetical protein NA57DRAFT_73019 [Rhizodiscina lignyota]
MGQNTSQIEPDEASSAQRNGFGSSAPYDHDTAIDLSPVRIVHHVDGEYSPEPYNGRIGVAGRKRKRYSPAGNEQVSSVEVANSQEGLKTGASQRLRASGEFVRTASSSEPDVDLLVSSQLIHEAQIHAESQGGAEPAGRGDMAESDVASPRSARSTRHTSSSDEMLEDQGELISEAAFDASSDTFLSSEHQLRAPRSLSTNRFESLESDDASEDASLARNPSLTSDNVNLQFLDGSPSAGGIDGSVLANRIHYDLQQSIEAAVSPRIDETESLDIQVRRSKRPPPNRQVIQDSEDEESDEYLPSIEITSSPSDHDHDEPEKTRSQRDEMTPDPSTSSAPPDDRSHLPSSGKFVNEEISLLDGVASKYRSRKNLSGSQFNDLVQRPINILTRDFWEELQEVLPNRTGKSIQGFCRRRWGNLSAENTPWNEELDAKLSAAFVVKPAKWTWISSIVGKSAGACRDRWRTHVQYGDDRRMDVWSSGEEEGLVRAVKECKAAIGLSKGELNAEEAADSEDSELDDSLNFATVSQRMGGTRSELQCRSKWKKMRRRKAKPAPEEEVGGSWYDSAPERKKQRKRERMSEKRQAEASAKVELMLAGDHYQILREIIDINPKDEESINWTLIRSRHPNTKWSSGEKKLALQKMKLRVDEKETFLDTLLAIKADIEKQIGDGVHMQYYAVSQKWDQGKPMPEIYTELRKNYLEEVRKEDEAEKKRQRGRALLQESLRLNKDVEDDSEMEAQSIESESDSLSDAEDDSQHADDTIHRPASAEQEHHRLASEAVSDATSASMWERQRAWTAINRSSHKRRT